MAEENVNETGTGLSKQDKELAAFLKSDRVPSNNIELTVKYDPVDKDGKLKYKTYTFRFTRIVIAYDRYMSDTFVKAVRGSNPLVITSSRQFVLDTVDPSQKEFMEGFLDAYPSEAASMASRLCEAYEIPGGAEEIKNG